MLRINQYNIEPGMYQCSGIFVVVTELVTHHNNGELKELEDPLVVYRDLEQKVEKYITYSMKLSEFKNKFKQA